MLSIYPVAMVVEGVQETRTSGEDIPVRETRTGAIGSFFRKLINHGFFPFSPWFVSHEPCRG